MDYRQQTRLDPILAAAMKQRRDRELERRMAAGATAADVITAIWFITCAVLLVYLCS